MQEKELLAETGGLFESTAELFFSDGWHLDKDKEDAKVYSKKHNNRTIFKLQGVVDAAIEEMIDDLSPEKMHEIPTWNTTLKKLHCLQKLDDTTIIFYSATHEFSAIISSRDQANLRKFGWKDGVGIFAYKTVQLDEVPPLKSVVRSESFECCQAVWPVEEDKTKTNFAWMMNMDYKMPALVPGKLFNEVCRWILLESMKCMHKHAKDKKAQREAEAKK
ncbi:unnamed protein product [Darwinula stevensoni]|uniref:START domain-containing protein n=1 Tax=Darwinula stevensoni TaxID=69355 RepID=A0A7R8X4M9_9CRUS|nr:unnamed protein product [Darwinula stevensoni]CAG0885319.1 unnamed protein product [Darwinula stevensoni]